jgi:DNA polymerase elongation subunit (family B)
MPAALSTLKVAVGGSVYQMGMGGLHSTESTAYHLTNEQVGLFDFDVSSYYPAIILNCGLYPEHLGESFLDIYRNLVAERLAAKRAGDMVKANALKITVNGSFGKLGSPYSALYSPDLMVQVTVTGQLSLLMLIEMLERYDLNVVSGNTDGIVVRTERHKIELMQTIIARWEKRTGFEMEMSEYVGLYCRDVNNYIAIKPDGSVKTKGVFSPASLNKNPQNEICSIAMIEYLKYGTPFEDTIRNCEDITKFLMVRTVKGGAMYGKKYLGKAVRWYHAKGSKMAITYRNNQNQVAMTYGSKPFMDLEGGFPDDIDYQWYIKECYTLF